MWLRSFAVTLTRKNQRVDSLRYEARELLIGRCIFEDAKFDFAYFSQATEQPVEVFGEFFETYHAAARDLFCRTFDAVFKVVAPKGNAITEQDIERFTSRNMGQVATAFRQATGLTATEAEAKLQWLWAALIKEAQRSYQVGKAHAHPAPSVAADAPGRFAAAAAAPPKAPPENKWWHDPSDSRPAEYKHGPIFGMKKEMCQWLGEKATRTPRRLEQKAKSGLVFVIRHTETSWEVWFKDGRAWELADRNRRFP
jgi:hypothetical protein